MKQKWMIGELAKMFDVSADTLRYYEAEGLLRSHRNEANGYRQYSYDDLFVLMDILLFRSLGLPVKEIQPLVTTKKLGEIKAVLQQNDRLIEEQMELLQLQRKQLAQIISQHEVCEKQLGQFSIVAAPAFQSKFLGTEVEDLIHVVKQYKAVHGLVERMRYTILLTAEEVQSNKNFEAAQMGVSFDDETIREFEADAQEKFSLSLGKECVYTVIGTNYSSMEHAVFEQARAWLAEQGRAMYGPLLGRYLASSYHERLDYYEIWIALQAT